MRMTTEGFACERHGVVAASTAEASARLAPVRAPRTPRAPRAPRMARPRPVSSQTQRLIATQETIVARNQAGESISSIAADLWHSLGYKNAYVCASKISRFLQLRGVEVAAARSGPAAGSQATPRFTSERFAEIEAALSAGETVWAFAGARWEEWGFTSRSSCDSLIRKWLRTKKTRVAVTTR